MIQYKEEIKKIHSLRGQKSLIEMQYMFDELEQQLKENEQYEEICDLYYNKAVYYFSYGLAVQALNVLMTKRQFIDQHASYNGLIAIRLATVVILGTLGYKKNYYETMLEINELAKLHGIEHTYRDTLNNLGYYFWLAGDVAQAEVYFKRCIEQCEMDNVKERNQTYLLAITNIAMLFLELERYDEMQEYLKKYETISYTKDPKFELSFILTHFNYARKINDFTLAKHYGEQLLQLAKEQPENPTVVDAYERLVDMYEQLNDVTTAIELTEQLLAYTDKLHNHAIQQQSIVCQYGLQQAQLLEDLKIDSLTGIYNRKGFMQFIERKLAAVNPSWKLFAIFDVDHFKMINDTHGHLIGDEVLKEISKRAVQFRLKAEAIQSFGVGRYGGDEFYVYLQASTLSQLKKSAQQFYDALQTEPFSYAHHTIPLSISLGGVYCQTSHIDFEKWFMQADKLLYDVKQNGRGQLKLAKLQTSI